MSTASPGLAINPLRAILSLACSCALWAGGYRKYWMDEGSLL